MRYPTIAISFFVSCCLLINSGSSVAKDSVSESWRKANSLQILNDFRDLLSLPNVAADKAAMNKNADWIEQYLQQREFKTKRLVAGGAPYIYAELNNPAATKTVLIYAHFDGQPVIADKWTTPPWQPTLRDNLVSSGGKAIPWPTKNSEVSEESFLFARSAGDDKAPVIALMAAIDGLKHAGIQPSVNIKLILDGEEEAGSPTLSKIIAQHGSLLKADLMLFCDGPMHQSRQRQLVFGVRGVMGVNLTTYGPKRPLHSGHYGNWAPNAAQQMASILASLHDQNGKIAIKNYYDDVRKITAVEQQAIDAMPNIDQQLKNELDIHSKHMKHTRVENSVMEPGVIITGIQVGSTGDKARNVVLPRATATVNMRLVANQKPSDVRTLVEKHFSSLGYFITKDEVTSEVLKRHHKVLLLNWGDSGYPAFRTSLASSMARQLNRILEELDGRKPLMTPTMGGSLPIYLFEQVVDAPIIILPVANHDNNQHGPDENIRIKNLWDAIDVYSAVITKL
ncbi:MAG: M20/M25/M40 family metallo-hydrolase [Kangiellaceae bacterium]|nr:M20/M25/M40 family metallo-hydrolase [Kangiellaceae bacterium]